MADPVKDNITLLDTAERREEVIRKKRMGKTYRTIAEEMEAMHGPDKLPGGWGPRYACQDVKAELEKYRNELRSGVEDLVEMQVQRIEEMVLALYPDARKGDDSAIAEIRKLMERKAELLGLDEAEEYVLSGGADGFSFGWANPEDAPKPNGTTNGKHEPKSK